MNLSESLNRTLKLALDDGTAATLADAEAMFRSFRVQLIATPEIAKDKALQAAMLTLLNAAPRTFHGGVSLSGSTEAVVSIGPFAGKSIACVAAEFGVTMHPPIQSVPAIVVGASAPERTSSSICVYLHCEPDGFVIGPDPIGVAASEQLLAPVEFGVLAAGVALNEVFQSLYFKRAVAGQRTLAYRIPNANARRVRPKSLWVIGLGHLGQAVLWTASLASDPALGTPHLTLQDFDTVTAASLSTGLLTQSSSVGTLKCDAASDWMTKAGFRCQAVRRAVELSQSCDAVSELTVVTVDSFGFRRQLDRIRGGQILEGGIGDGPQGFTKAQIHLLPGHRTAADIWGSSDPRATRRANVSTSAYERLIAETGDECGIVQLAERSIATPFVGAFVGSLLYAFATRERSVCDSFAFDLNALQAA